MRALRAFLLRIRGVLRREDASQDFSEQIQADIELHIEDAVRSGMSREDARRTALLKFGGIDSATEAWRDRHGLPFLETFLRDVRYALRVLARNKGWSAVAVASLALGVGANAVMFSAANRLLLRKLPVPEADRLVTLQWKGENKAMTFFLDYGYVPGGALDLLAENKEFTLFDIRAGATGAYETFQRMHDANHTLTHLFAAVGGPTVNLIVDGHGDTASSQFVSGEFYTALGIPPAAGRTLLPTDDQKGAPPVAVLGHGYWQRRFGGDRAIVGKQVRVNTVALTIVGVSGISMPDPISSGETYDIAIPLAAERILQAGESRLDDPLSWWLVMMGRMKPGVTPAQVESDLSPVYDAASRDAVKGMLGKLSEKDRKEAHEFGFGERIPRLHVVSGARGAYEPVPLDSTALVIFAVLVGMVLLAVCANLANLSLAATTSREREIAVRRAIGASRRRLIGQILTEHIVVAIAGGALSLLVAYLLQDLVRLRIPTQFDWTVVGFAFVVSVATGIAIGVLPALRASRSTEGLPASGATGRRSRFASALLVSQVLLSTVLLIGAGLFLRTLVNLRNIDPGFETSHLVLFTIDPKFSQYNDAKTEALYTELLTKLGTLPGVSSASFSDNSLLGNGFNTTEIYAGGGGAATPQKQFAYKVVIQQDFFKTMGIPLRHGRPFASHDVAKAPQVAIINESLARALFGDTNAVGQRFSGDKDSAPDTEVVGVVADTRHRTLRDAPRPMVFVPHLQAVQAPASTDEVKSSTSATGARTFEVRTAVPAEKLMPAIGQVVHAADPSLPIIQLSTQATALEFHWAQERAIALASATFGGLTLVVTMIGLFGLMSYVVARRTKEIAIRMALGARSGNVLLSVLGEALSVVGIGIVAGLGVAVATTRFLKTQLFGLSPTDPLVIGAAILVMLAVAAAAAYIPARRAARVAPMVALRED